MPEGNTTGKYKVLVIVLVILVLLSGGALAARMFYLNNVADKEATIMVPDNTITEEPADHPAPDDTPAPPEEDGGQDAAPAPNTSGTSATQTSGNAPGTGSTGATGSTGGGSSRFRDRIELHQGQAIDNARFKVENMLPGDSVTQSFQVRVRHYAAIRVYFDTVVNEDVTTNDLDEIMNIKVVRKGSNKEIYNDTFKNLQNNPTYEDIPAATGRRTDATYIVTVSLPQEAGNKYQASELMADLRWYVVSASHGTGGGTSGGSTVGGSEVLAPATGDAMDMALWGTLAASSAALIVLLVFRRKRKEAVR